MIDAGVPAHVRDRPGRPRRAGGAPADDRRPAGAGTPSLLPFDQSFDMGRARAA
ncbi:hypothetical protein ABZZ80_14175 [Streptomyces sp. NPDC006356]